MPKKDLDEWIWQISTELNRLSGEIASTPKFAKQKLWEPNVDIIETPSYFLIRVEIAGVQSEDIKIYFDLNKNSLTIRGQREELGCDEKLRQFHQLEVFYGEFEREIILPNMPLKSEEIKAQYRNGFLNIYIPKDVEKIEAIVLEKIHTLRRD